MNVPCLAWTSTAMCLEWRSHMDRSRAGDWGVAPRGRACRCMIASVDLVLSKHYNLQVHAMAIG
eukprot:1709512-Prymnesium_polylepis.1